MGRAQHDIDVAINMKGRGFHAAMADIRKDVDKTANSSGSAFSQMSSRLGGLTRIAKASAASITIAAGAFVGFAKSAKDASQSVVDLSSQARRAGVGFESFQELGYAAERNRVSIDLLSDGLYEMNLRAAEFAKTGKGPGEDAFKRLGLGADQVAEKLEKPDELFQDIIDRVRQLDDASQKFVLDEIFAGSAAESFVNLLETSNEEFDTLRQNARDLGIVMDEDVLKKAEEINKQWDQMAMIVSSRVKEAVIEVGAAILKIIKDFDELQGRGFRVQQKTPSAKESSDELARLISEKADLEALLAGAGDNIGLVSRYEMDLAKIRDEIEFVKNQAKAVLNTTHPGHGANWEYIPRKKTVEEIVDDGDGKKNKKKKEERDLVKEVTKALQQEFELLGKTELQRKRMVALRKANVDELSKEGKQITQLVDQIYLEEQALEAIEKASEDAKEAQDQLFDHANDLIDKAIDGTLDWGDALSIVAKELNALLQGENSIFDLFRGGSGGGFLGSLFGSFFGGGGGYPVPGQIGLFANGGITQHGQSLPVFANGGVSSSAAIFGEGFHAEAAVPLPGDRKIPVNMNITGGGKGGGSPMSFHYAPVLEYSGPSDEFSKIQRQIDEDRARFFERSIEAYQEGLRRGYL